MECVRADALHTIAATMTSFVPFDPLDSLDFAISSSLFIYLPRNEVGYWEVQFYLQKMLAQRGANATDSAYLLENLIHTYFYIELSIKEYEMIKTWMFSHRG